MKTLGAVRTPWGRILLVWLAFVAMMLAINFRAIAETRFLDPDDVLRLVQVRDLISGQGWFDLHQYRINPGDSPVMHWSRIVDVPIALVILVFRPLLGQPLAEQFALVLVPLLTMAAIMAVIGRMATRLFDRRIAWLACVAAGLAPLLVSQVQPLRIDHHGWQIFTVIFALGALMGRRPGTGGALAGALAGAALATGLSISLEVLPLAAAFGAVLLLRWLRDPSQRWAFAAYLGTLAGVLALWFGVTRGTDFTEYCDIVSPAYLAFFGVVGLAALGIASRPRLPVGAVLVLLGLAGVAGLALFLTLAPQCSSGPFGNLDPLVRQYWYANVLEGRPFWSQPFDQSIPMTMQGFVALAVTLRLWRKSTGPLKSLWFDYLLLLAATLVAGLLVWRSMAFVGAMTAVPFGWLLELLVARYRATAKPLAQLAIGFAALFVVMPFTPVVLARSIVPQAEPEQHFAESNCDVRSSAAALAQLPPATIFAPIDIGPALLERTPHSVVATAHHRAQLAIHDVIAAFIGPEAQAREIIGRHSARYLVICTDLTETKLYSKVAPNGFMAQLLKGKASAWLKPVQLDMPPTFKVWQVVG